MSVVDPSNLVWMDLEMTGLDPDKEEIIEIATIVTDSQMNIIAEGPSLVIHQEDALLEKMDEWNQKTHSASGLIQKVRESTLTVEEAERMTLDFIKKHVPYKTSPLCGNSIQQDRRFLDRSMKDLTDYLHYRNIDVTSIKEVIRRWYPNGTRLPKKSDSHMALTDVRESIEELIFYRNHFFIDLAEYHPEDGDL
ncbi:oligoribonuclease [Nitrospina watsonii]|uniref:Oligoribonuclease n=1 Tax=Nitrospina watsonii TaxID=1323948 RepID=A0ABN8VZE2_9BACT|nr:oligoribonuclease [Nitrospina watsonii]CAI2717326.1 oligoribonuclease [Nitrospina watsonii]